MTISQHLIIIKIASCTMGQTNSSIVVFRQLVLMLMFICISELKYNKTQEQGGSLLLRVITKEHSRRTLHKGHGIIKRRQQSFQLEQK